MPPLAVPLRLLAAGIVLYGAALAFGSKPGFPSGMQEAPGMPYLADKPIGEDGYYLLTVAWNLGRGDGLTYSQGVQTTGIQPLVTLLYGGLAALVQAAGGTRWDFARLVILFGALNAVLIGVVVGVLAREALPAASDPAARQMAFFVGTVLALTDFWVFRIATYGLETGLLLLLIGVFALWMIRRLPSMTLLDAVGAGLLAGLCGLARISFGVSLGVLLLVLLARRRLSPGHGLAIGLTALAVVLPWFVWVHGVTGRWLPSSGPAQARMVTLQDLPDRLVAMSQALVNHLTPWAYTANRPALTLLAGLSLLGVAAVLWAGRRRLGPVRASTPWVDVMGAFLGGVGVLAATYVALFRSTHFYDRYTASLLIVVLPGLAWLVVTTTPPRWLRHAAVPATAGLTLTFALWAGVSLHRGTTGNAHAVTAGFLQTSYPTARVGAFQSGVIGYVHPDVVNLDGKVDPRALAAAEQGTLTDFVGEAGIEVLVDWSKNLHRLDLGAMAATWEPCPENPDNGMTHCLQRRPARLTTTGRTGSPSKALR